MPVAWRQRQMVKSLFGAVTVKHPSRRKWIEELHIPICLRWCLKVSFKEHTFVVLHLFITKSMSFLSKYFDFQLENDATGLQWKWVSVKAGGYRPPPRSGISVTVAPNGKAYTFGGVLDVNEDEENLEGQFTNEMHILDLSNPTWRLVELKGKKENKASKSEKEENDDQMDTSAPTSQGNVISYEYIQ